MASSIEHGHEPSSTIRAGSLLTIEHDAPPCTMALDNTLIICRLT